MQLKLDELIRGTRGARNELVDLEDLSDEELEELQKGFAELRAELKDNPIADALHAQVTAESGRRKPKK
jgi:low affinity Fe/Cu permease